MRVIILLLLFVIIILIIYTNQLKDGIREAEKIIGINNLKYKLELIDYHYNSLYNTSFGYFLIKDKSIITQFGSDCDSIKYKVKLDFLKTPIKSEKAYRFIFNLNLSDSSYNENYYIRKSNNLFHYALLGNEILYTSRLTEVGN
ncbi:MAG: hypothetical protein V9E90_04320 [Saprospiraceae bacterium]